MAELMLGQLFYIFNQWDFTNGEHYAMTGRVTDYMEYVAGDDLDITCTVRGTQRYMVHVAYLGDQGIYNMDTHCTCPRFKSRGICKHVAAALVAHFQLKKNPQLHPQWQQIRVPKTSAAAKNLLKAMQELPERTQEAKSVEPPEQAHITMVMRVPEFGSMLELSFKVGIKRAYVVRNISEFLMRVDRGETYSYGKQLTMCHAIECFDEPSRAIIDFMRTQYQQQQIAVYRYGYNSATKYSDHYDFSPAMLETYFDTLRDMEPVSGAGKPIAFVDGEPELNFWVKSNGEIVSLERDNTLDEYRVLYGNRRLFFIRDNTIQRASEAFSRVVQPLIKAGNAELVFTPEDTAAFCSLVLPRINPFVNVVDEKNILSRYLPEACVPRFYFDLDSDMLTCRLVYHYDAADIPHGETVEGVRRDARAEAGAVQLLDRDFGFNPIVKRFEQPDENRYMTLLSDGFSAHRAMGEVYISQRLRDREVSRPKATVGVSLSGGMLTLSFDTGGFPPEELEALYNSMLLKRRYHRLRDGRFMWLSGDGSGIEAVAETAHMTQLDSEALKAGEARLPAFRALYLDGVLDRREGLRVRRDEAFRDMVRRFKTVEDSDYAVPEGIEGELRPYQETGYRWLKTLESCGFGGILADEMGLGKTLQMIAFFASAPRAETGLPHLVVCPASLVLNWGDELSRFAPGLKVRLMAGNLRERKAMLSEEDEADVWVTSYDLLKRDIDLYDGRSFYSCVLDEGQFVKNQSTRASKAVKRIDCRQRFVLTGTPIENRLSELWNLFDFLMPGYLFSHNRFVEKLERPIAQREDADATAQLNRLVRPFMLRRLKKDVLRELPDKIDYVRRIPLSEEERKLYHAQAVTALTQLGEGREKLAILAALTRLRQICCDPHLCFENYEGDSSKLEACLELISSMTENGHQVLLFSQFTSMLDRVRARLKEMGISSFTLQGSTPPKERARLVKAFNEGGASVFLISLKAGGTGLNLTAADVVIHFDPWWNIAAQNQATDRAHRIGQTKCVQVYRLIAQGTVEERILDLQRKKAALLDAVSENAGEDLARMSSEELMALFRED